ncbi:helix-turn-helix transcriptional regulator [Aestuariirhabdus litorea]|uniref:LuxR family transcriptional regulator n=1 Tax=Aestuariirhabdus litorea TaxID=2528527 RepID=A0A3P3VR82_9GAMM|nr:LuxR C-terminal-related transcriptional regulator [Aestuariirhabdus litorea]RRJ85302.1 LuxR family transcriptional regulator [Aestuariirhabdus litorea]RWW98524.1 LuxR family transcriptional regulator [Endozoicomonadaceae bacterium GTF-13]
MTDKPSAIALNAPWQKNLAVLIDHHRLRSFPVNLEAYLGTLCRFDTFLMITFKESCQPIIIHPTDPDQQSQSLRHYLDRAYVLDPLFNAIQQGLPPGVTRLAQIMPDSFEATEYYQSCYQNFGLKDEIDLCIRLDEQTTCAIALGRRTELGPITRRELKQLSEHYPLIDALVRQFWLSQAADYVQYERSDGPLKQALDSFASGVLTQREREVTALILRGFSTQAIAETLGISAATVKVHRKNIHARLNTSTQSEIFSLFIAHLGAREAPAGPPA